MMMGGFGMILNMIFWIIVVGIIIYGVMILIMKPFERKEDKAIEVLKERFARGEIDEQEYFDRKSFLKQNK